MLQLLTDCNSKTCKSSANFCIYFVFILFLHEMNDENAGIGILKMRFTGINFMQSMELLFRHMSAHGKGHCTYPPRNIKISNYSDHKKQAPCYLGVCVSGQMDCMRSLTEKILMQPA